MTGSLVSKKRLLCEGWLDEGCEPGDGLVMYPTTGYVEQGTKVWIAFGEHKLDESAGQSVVESFEDLELEERRVGDEVLRLPKGGRWFVEGPFQRSDVENANRRKYPRGIWERLIADDKSYVQKSIRERAMVGHLEHPGDGRTDGAKGAILVTKATLEKDGTVMGQAEILDTPMGLILQEYTKKRVRWGVSSRGNGSVKDDGTVDEDNYVLETWDAVMKPSVPGAYPTVAGSKPLGNATESLEENFPVKQALEFLRGKPEFKHVKWEKGAADMSHVLVFKDEDVSRDAFTALKDKFGAKLNARRNGEAIDFYESVVEGEVDPKDLLLKLTKVAKRAGATMVVLLANGHPLFYGTAAAAKEAWNGLLPAARDKRLTINAYLQQLGATEAEESAIVAEAEFDADTFHLTLAKAARRLGAKAVIVLSSNFPLFFGDMAQATAYWKVLHAPLRGKKVTLQAYLAELGAEEEEETEESVLAEVEIGDTVVVKQAKNVPPNSTTGAFIGKRGRVIDMEKDGSTKMWRVRFDDPVQVPGVGDVEDDLFSGAFLRKLREDVDEAAKLHVVYLPANKAYQTMFGDTPTGIGDGNRRIFNDLEDLKYELRAVGLKLGKKVGKGYEIVDESLAEDSGDVTLYVNPSDLLQFGGPSLPGPVWNGLVAHLRNAVDAVGDKALDAVRAEAKRRIKKDAQLMADLRAHGRSLKEHSADAPAFEGMQGDAKEYGLAVSALVETDVTDLEPSARATLHRQLLDAMGRGSALADAGHLSDQAYRRLQGWLTEKLSESMGLDVSGLGDAIDEAIRHAQVDETVDRRDGFDRVTTSLRRRLEDALADATSSRERLEAAESRGTAAEGQFRVAVEQLAEAERKVADLGRRLSLAEGLLATRPTAEARETVVGAVDEAVSAVPELASFRSILERAGTRAEVVQFAEALLPRVAQAPELPDVGPGLVAERSTLPRGRVSSVETTRRVVESTDAPRGARVAAGAMRVLGTKQ